MKKSKVFKGVLLLIGAIAISFSARSLCIPPSYFLANGGYLVPYYENRVLVGEKCLLGGTECSCIGMIYYY